jgi:broad specificity phosphatase PhoE
MAKLPRTRVLVVRAGATEWDEAGRVQGAVDLPLSPTGRANIEELVSTLAPSRLTAVLCAPDESSVETAGLVAAATGATVPPDPDLGEVHLGLWEGLPLAELESRYPRACRQWMDDPACVNAPDGENLAEAAERIIGTVAKAVEKARSGAVGVVLRPFALGLVRCWLADAPTCEFWTEVKEAPGIEWFTLPGERAKARTQAASSG